MPRNLLIAASLPAAPEALYDAYLDPATHAAFTGHAVNIEARAEAHFTAFDGVLRGVILYLEPKRLIVQTWRSINFGPDDIDSILVLTFWPQDGGACIELSTAQRRRARFRRREPGLGEVLLSRPGGRTWKGKTEGVRGARRHPLPGRLGAGRVRPGIRRSNPATAPG